MDEGWRRIEMGDFDGARLIALEARQVDPGLHQETAWLEGVAWQLQGEPDAAAGEFRALLTTWPTGAFARHGRFRLAWALADQGRWSAALRELRRLGDREALLAADPEGVDALKVDLSEATWRLERGAWRAGYIDITLALDAPQATQLPWFVARSRLAILHHSLERAENVSFRAPLGASDARMAHQVDTRGLLVQEATDQLNAIVDLGESWAILASLEALGDQFDDLADDLLASPAPPRLSPAQVELYRAGLHQKATDQRIKALRYWELAVQHLLNVGWLGDDRERLERRIAEITLRIEADAR